MKRILIAALALCSSAAFAQMDVRTARASQHNFSALLSKNTGGFSLGAGYEYMYDGATGVGAHIRSFSKEDSGPNRNHGYMIFGAALGHHFFKGKWDLAFTPSFNMISIDALGTTPGDSTTMGPGMSISLVWALTEMISLGFDYSNYWVWFDDDWAGLRMSDMALKLKIGI